jgi:hypothetical protein
MSKLLDQAVTKGDDGWDVVCPITDGSCGAKAVTDETGKVVEDAKPFQSTGWPTKAIARDRLDGHIAEHKGEAEPVSLEDFRAKHNLAASKDGKTAHVITVKDI